MFFFTEAKKEMTDKEYFPFEGAEWIAPSYALDTCLIKRSFRLDSIPEHSELFITGLGYFEATLNGAPLTEDMLIPPVSDYFRREFRTATYKIADEFTHRIYYHKFSVGDRLTVGENILEINLGGGWLTQRERLAEGEMEYSDRPMCIYALRIPSGDVLSSSDDVFYETEIRASSLFIGETIDSRFVDSLPKKVKVLPRPDAILSEAIGSNDKIIRTISPTLLSERGDVRIYDARENISGLVSLTTDAPSGSVYVLRFAENLSADGSLDFKSTGEDYIGRSGERQIMCDRFITDGRKRRFIPKFLWHAFRYFEIRGDFSRMDEPIVTVIHADTPLTAEFESDSEGLNFLFDAYVRTQLANYHGSFPSDCPHRERLGYTGDGQVCAKAAMMLLDTRELYRKWIRDILDCQDVNSGHVQHTAPFGGGGGGPGGWCSAIITVPYAYYKQFGKDDFLIEALPKMRRWIDFTESCTEGSLVVREVEGGWCLGDWCMLESGKLPESFVNTCCFIHAMRLYLEMLDGLMSETDPRVEALISESTESTSKLYKTISHIGAASAFAAWIGIDSAERAAKYYDKLGHFDTGFIGTDVLSEVLLSHGHGEVWHKLLSSEKLGSFLYMKRHGATTVWERWNGTCSHNHPMFGASARQIFEGILGIRQTEDSVGYERVKITPYLPKDMSYARGSILTPRGRITVTLSRTEGTERFEIDLPESIRRIY